MRETNQLGADRIAAVDAGARLISFALVAPGRSVVRLLSGMSEIGSGGRTAAWSAVVEGIVRRFYKTPLR